MKFIIHRASHKPIGDEITLLSKVEIENFGSGEYGLVEINDLSQLPKEDFILRYHTNYQDDEALELMSLSENDVDGAIILYDDYIE